MRRYASMARSTKRVAIGPGSISTTWMPLPCELHAERVGQSLDGKFRGAIGAAIGRADEPEHRGAEHDPPLPALPHRRDHAGGQIVPAEHIGLELGAEHVAPDVFQRTRLAVAAIVEQRVELAVSCLEHMLGSFGDRVRLRIVEIEALDPDLILEAGDVFRLPRRGEHAPAARLQCLARRKARYPTSNR